MTMKSSTCCCNYYSLRAMTTTTTAARVVAGLNHHATEQDRTIAKVGEFRGGRVQKVFLQVNRGRGAVLEGIKTLTTVVLEIRSNIQHGNQAEKRPERIEQFPSRSRL